MSKRKNISHEVSEEVSEAFSKKTKGNSRTFIFVINDIDQTLTKNIALNDVCSFDSSQIRYAQWQLERGGNSEHLHIQGWAATKESMKCTTFKKMFLPYKPHIEVMKRTELANSIYCTKSETQVDGFLEFGIRPDLTKGQGARNDLIPIHNAIKERIPLQTLLKTDESSHNAFIKYNCGIEKLYRYLELPLTDIQPKQIIRDVMLIYGKPGTGKTEIATDSDSCYIKEPGEWFTGYSGQKRLVIDEFNSGWIQPDILKRLLDKYPVQVKVHGGMVNGIWEEVVITTNNWIENWYAPEIWLKHQDLLQALTRRIHTYVRTDREKSINEWYSTNDFEEFKKYCESINCTKKSFYPF